MRFGVTWVAATILGTASAGLSCGMDDPEQVLEGLLTEYSERERSGEPAASLAALESRIDALAGQKDAVFSGLYWHRDLEQAKQAAEARGLPVLSLRLLGELTSDRSCANSRFFRTALYANEALAAWLRENVVLHWESVRPAPVVVIDMGDGRRIERTITGNSIHWLLLPDGQVVDGFPGLYGPWAFRGALEPAVETARRALERPAHARAGFLRDYHQGLARAGVELLRAARDGNPPRAGEAAPLAITKCMVERPLLAALGDVPGPEDARWLRSACLYLDRCRLDARSRRLMLRKSPRSQRTPEAQAALAERFEELMARDTARNEGGLRPVLHTWLATGAGGDLTALNRRVYAEMFLTPEDDPWLGLAPPGEYAALEEGGLIDR